jgi:hypothetical protein
MHPGRLGDRLDPAPPQLMGFRPEQPALPLVQMRAQHRVLPRHRLRGLRNGVHSTDDTGRGAENLVYFVA